MTIDDDNHFIEGRAADFVSGVTMRRSKPAVGQRLSARRITDPMSGSCQ